MSELRTSASSLSASTLFRAPECRFSHENLRRLHRYLLQRAQRESFVLVIRMTGYGRRRTARGSSTNVVPFLPRYLLLGSCSQLVLSVAIGEDTGECGPVKLKALALLCRWQRARTIPAVLPPSSPSSCSSLSPCVDTKRETRTT